jgi:hypothetical protein
MLLNGNSIFLYIFIHFRNTELLLGMLYGTTVAPTPTTMTETRREEVNVCHLLLRLFSKAGMIEFPSVSSSRVFSAMKIKPVLGRNCETIQEQVISTARRKRPKQRRV